MTSTFGANRHQLHALRLDESERLIDVGDLVEPHLSAVGLRQLLRGDDFEEQHQLQAALEVRLDVFDLHTSLAQMGVTPSSECLRKKYELTSI